MSCPIEEQHMPASQTSGLVWCGSLALDPPFHAVIRVGDPGDKEARRERARPPTRVLEPGLRVPFGEATPSGGWTRTRLVSSAR